MWRRCRSKWLEGWVQPEGIEAPILAQGIPWVLHKLQWLSNSGVSYSASARLSRLGTVLTASLLLNEDLLDPTLIPFQLPNSTLMLLDSLFHECPFYLEPTTTTYSVPLIITPASCCWMNLILFNPLSALLNLLITLLPYVYIHPFPPTTILMLLSLSCALIIHLREHNHRHCLSCYPFPMGINEFKSW